MSGMIESVAAWLQGAGQCAGCGQPMAGVGAGMCPRCLSATGMDRGSSGGSTAGSGTADTRRDTASAASGGSGTTSSGSASSQDTGGATDTAGATGATNTPDAQGASGPGRETSRMAVALEALQGAEGPHPAQVSEAAVMNRPDPGAETSNTSGQRKTAAATYGEAQSTARSETRQRQSPRFSDVA